jgi:hypothetical protein
VLERYRHDRAVRLAQHEVRQAGAIPASKLTDFKLRQDPEAVALDTKRAGI